MALPDVATVVGRTRPWLLPALGLCAFFVMSSALGPWARYTLVQPDGNASVIPGLAGARFATGLLGLGLCGAVLAAATWKSDADAWPIVLLAGFAAAIYVGATEWVSFERREFLGRDGTPYELSIQTALIMDLAAAATGAVISSLLLWVTVFARPGVGDREP